MGPVDSTTEIGNIVEVRARVWGVMIDGWRRHGCLIRQAVAGSLKGAAGQWHTRSLVWATRYIVGSVTEGSPEGPSLDEVDRRSELRLSARER